MTIHRSFVILKQTIARVAAANLTRYLPDVDYNMLRVDMKLQINDVHDSALAKSAEVVHHDSKLSLHDNSKSFTAARAAQYLEQIKLLEIRMSWVEFMLEDELVITYH